LTTFLIALFSLLLPPAPPTDCSQGWEFCKKDWACDTFGEPGTVTPTTLVWYRDNCHTEDD
jgi:hypothetical protein